MWVQELCEFQVPRRRYLMTLCQEELNLSDTSMVPFGFAQMAPVVEVGRAYNLISSACKQSLSLGGEMMIEFTEACCFTFYRAIHKYSHHFQ